MGVIKTANQFLSNFIKSDIVEVKNISVNEKLKFIPNNYKSRYVVIKDCNFHQEVIFESIDLNLGIKFINCSFAGSLKFIHTTSNGYEPDLDNDYNYTNIIFEECHIQELLLFESNEYERGINIKRNCTIKNILLLRNKISSGSIQFEESTFLGQFRINSLVILGMGEMRIHKSSLKSASTYFESLQVNSLTFTESHFESYVFIWNVISKSGLVCNNGVFNENVLIKACKLNGHLSSIGDDFKKDLLIELDDNTNSIKGSLENIYLKEVMFGNSFILKGANESISELIIHSSQNLTGSLSFENCCIEKTIIKGDNHKGNFIFSDCKFKIIEIHLFSNYGNLSFFSCNGYSNKDSLFKISRTYLGKVQLFNFSFESFSTINISDSYLGEIITSNTEWFSSHKLVTQATSPLEDNRKKREVYRQIKQALEKQGDKIHALEFQARELNAFRNEIKLNKSYKFRDKFILWIGQTNDFGLNWVKPFIIVLAITTLFYLFLAIETTSEINWAPAKRLSEILETFKIFYNNLYLFPQLFNPTRGINKIFYDDKIILSSLVFFFDALHRIVLAFFIVQIVTAFRKYFK